MDAEQRSKKVGIDELTNRDKYRKKKMQWKDRVKEKTEFQVIRDMERGQIAWETGGESMQKRIRRRDKEQQIDI